jgi:hypothetical protein
MLRIALVIDDYNELIYLQTLLKKLGLDVEGLQNTKKYSDLSLGFNPYVLITSAKGKKVNGLALAKSLSKPRGIPKVIALQSSSSPVTPEEKEHCKIDAVIDSPVNVFKLIMALSEAGNLDEAQLIEKYNKIKNTLNDALIQGGSDNGQLEYDENGQPIRSRDQLKNDLDNLVTKPIDNNHDINDSESHAPLFPIDTAYENPNIDNSNAHLNRDENKSNESDEVINRNLNERNKLLNELISQSLDENRITRASRYESWLKNMEPLINSNFDRERIISFNKMIRSAAKDQDIADVEDERKKFVRAMFKKTTL